MNGLLDVGLELSELIMHHSKTPISTLGADGHRYTPSQKHLAVRERWRQMYHQMFTIRLFEEQVNEL